MKWESGAVWKVIVTRYRRYVSRHRPLDKQKNSNEVNRLEQD